jgi:putative FmdB family regulatory protein
MPIYEYLCKDCGREFEKIVPRADSTTECVHCNGQNLEKQLSVFAVAGGSSDSAADLGCGRCGAAQPGTCGMEN